MATIGQPLTAPETGWKRYDDRDAHISYEPVAGNTVTRWNDDAVGIYQGTETIVPAAASKNARIRFGFTGTKLRVMGTSFSNRVGASIYIDGVDMGRLNEYLATGVVRQTLLFDKSGLADADHKVTILIDQSGVSGNSFSLDAIDIDGTGRLTTFDNSKVVGDQLLQPESGWKRYDDTHNAFQYNGTWSTLTTSGDAYGKTEHYTNVTGTTVEFSFVGTQLRLIHSKSANRSNAIEVDIDGVKETYSGHGATVTPQALVYEKRGLAHQEHKVTLTLRSTDNTHLIVDAVDIDEAGYLLIPREIGKPLLTPDDGWKRYDDTHPTIKYVGSGWTSTSHQRHYNGGAPYTTSGDGAVRFYFTGDRLRIISSLDISSKRSTATISIDGEMEQYSLVGSEWLPQTLVYEKTGFGQGAHVVEISNDTNGKVFTIDAIDIDEAGELIMPTAQIGDQLLQPEAGWKRYDDTHPAIIYDSKITASDARSFNGSFSNGVKGVKFSFRGTKIRIISGTHSSTKNAPIHIAIDGVEETYTENWSTSGASYQMLSYEKTNLSEEIHTVLINTSASNATLDAIDIDEDGELLHPDEVFTPEELEIGKRIRAHYQAPTSGQVGTFSHLGEEVYVDGSNDFIPPASAATVNGSFYYICVDEYNDKKIVVADRNIAHSISWDTLNSEGFVNGRYIAFDGFAVEDISFTTRLLTGGETSEDAAHSEWDQYIVNSSLNGSITPGDAQAWSINSSLGSWTSTVPSGSPSSRVSRGRNTVAAHTFAASSTVSGVYGFRPLLEIEVIPPPPVMKYLIEDEGEIKKYISSIEGDMIKEDAYTGEGTLLYIPVYKEAFIRVK